MTAHKEAARQGGPKESNQQRDYSTLMLAMSSPVLQTLAVLCALFALFALLVRECAI